MEERNQGIVIKGVGGNYDVACEGSVLRCRASAKLNNPGFLAKAPEKVVNDERAKREVLARQLANVEEVYNKL